MAKIIRVETWRVAPRMDVDADFWTVYKVYYDSGTCKKWTDRYSVIPQTVLDFVVDHYCLVVLTHDYDYLADEHYPHFYIAYHVCVYADDRNLSIDERFWKIWDLDHAY